VGSVAIVGIGTSLYAGESWVAGRVLKITLRAANF
jgi:hypothetical protein